MDLKLKQRIFQQYGPWALVTGASSGIGRALCVQLAASGYNLIINARRERRLWALAEKLERLNNIRVEVIAGDMGLQEHREKLLDMSMPYDVGLLVNAAGFGSSGKFKDSDLSNQVDMLEVNCKAPLILSKEFGARFTKRASGGIIMFSSIVAFQGVPWAAHYAATKAYIQSLAESLHIEYYPFGVDVLAVAPGPVQTGFAERADMQLGAALNPDEIALPILKALGRKSTVYPGVLTKVLTGSLRLLPRWGKVKVMQQVMKGMSLHAE
jgi:short-subunit dehydrogenase